MVGWSPQVLKFKVKEIHMENSGCKAERGNVVINLELGKQE